MKKLITFLLGIILTLIAIYIGFLIGQNKQNVINIDRKENKLDIVLDIVQQKYVDSVSIDSITEQSLPLIMEQLDPHSAYVPAQDMEEVNEPLEGNFEGIGVVFNMATDTIAVINVIVGGPAARAGVEAGDRIISIDDSVVAGKKIGSDKIMKRLRGKSGSIVKVDIKRQGFEKMIPIEITRGKIPLKSVDVAYMATPEIGYIKMSKFARTTYDEFMEAVEKLQKEGMQKMILDLRENTGGFLDQAHSIASEFFDKKEIIVYTEGHSSPRHYLYSTGKGKLGNIDLAVLIDEFSASASEILAGAVQDNDRGVIVGRRSFGKGLVQEPIMFTDGSGIRLTIARYYTPTGRCIQKPYNKGNDEDYTYEIIERYRHNEMLEKDSIHFADTTKYITPKGKVLYGGGGIMPDIFVPIDTIGSSNKFWTKLVQKNIVYTYTMNFTDQNRAKINSIKNIDELRTFLNSKNIFENFLAFAAQKGVVPTKEERDSSREILTTQLKALIGRNTSLDDNGFYPIYGEIDKTLQKAISVLNGEK